MGLAQGVKEIYPLKPVQRCLVHKIRNVLATCRRNKAAVARSLRAIWAATTRREALAAVKAFEAEWVVEEKRARDHPQARPAPVPHLPLLPRGHHKAVRTTNALERSFRELRRRTRPMGTYVNAASADRIMFGVTEEMNERWRGAPQLAKSAS
jgi:putative transposase